MARVVRDEFPELALHLGAFANVYTGAGAGVYRTLGAARIAPPAELPLDEVAELARAAGSRWRSPCTASCRSASRTRACSSGASPSSKQNAPTLCQQDVFLSRGRVGAEVRRHRHPQRAGRVSARASPAPDRGRAPALPRRGRLGDPGLSARWWGECTGRPSTRALAGDARHRPGLVGDTAGALAGQGSATGSRSAGAASSTSAPPAPPSPTRPAGPVQSTQATQPTSGGHVR